MGEAAAEFTKLARALGAQESVAVGQLFGKACVKVNGKAFLAQQGDRVVFKLTGSHHEKALKEKDAILWDPSGKNRPMKEWVALTVEAKPRFAAPAKAALAYVREGA